MYNNTTAVESLDRLTEAYSALSEVWSTAHTQVQKDKGGVHLMCYKISHSLSLRLESNCIIMQSGFVYILLHSLTKRGENVEIKSLPI